MSLSKDHVVLEIREGNLLIEAEEAHSFIGSHIGLWGVCLTDSTELVLDLNLIENIENDLNKLEQ